MRTFREEFLPVDYGQTRRQARSSTALDLPAPQTLLPGFLEGRGDDVDCVPQPTRETLKLPGLLGVGSNGLAPRRSRSAQPR